MAKVQQSRDEGTDRVCELARDIFLSLIASNNSRTATHNAGKAFEEAEAFYTFAEQRKTKNESEK